MPKHVETAERGGPGVGSPAESSCLNCGADVAQLYCPMCGQQRQPHRSLAALWHDIVHGVVHLDGRLSKTLPLLALRPGELTRRYCQGERRKFVSPLGMFLFSVFLMFAVLQVSGASLGALELGPLGVANNLEAADRAIAAQLGRTRAERAAVAREVETPSRRKRVAELDRRISRLSQDRSRLDRIRRSGATFVSSDQSLETGSPLLDKGFAKFRGNPALALYKLQANGYKFAWLLIPISVPALWLLFFWNGRFALFDHSVFVTYSLAAMLLLALVLTLLSYAGLPVAVIAVAALVLPPTHMFVQLRQAYQLSWPAAAVRALMLVLFCLATAVLFFLLLLGIGAMG